LQRVKLSFAKGLEIEFIDRERAIKQVYEMARKVLDTRLLSMVLRVVVKLHG